MADLGPQEESTQSFVVRAWQETPGHWRGTVRHVQSKTQHGFTRLNQAHDFMEQHLTAHTKSIATPRKAATPAARSFNWHQRKFVLAMVSVVIVIVAGISITLVANDDTYFQSLLGAAGGQLGEVAAALLIGVVLGGLGSYVWLRRHLR